MNKKLLILAFLASISSLLSTLFSVNSINTFQANENATASTNTSSEIQDVGFALAILTTFFASLSTFTNLSLMFFGNRYCIGNARERERIEPDTVNYLTKF